MKNCVLSTNNISEIMQCIDMVKADIACGFYYPSSEVEIANILQHSADDSSFTVGIRKDGILIAFATMEIYDGIEIQIELMEDEKRVLIIQDTVVLPDFRGNNLQKKLWTHLFSLCKKNDVIVCTIHPDNTPSLKNAQSLGMKIIGMRDLYDGHPRLVLKKSLIDNL